MSVGMTLVVAGMVGVAAGRIYELGKTAAVSGEGTRASLPFCARIFA